MKEFVLTKRATTATNDYENTMQALNVQIEALKSKQTTLNPNSLEYREGLTEMMKLLQKEK